MIDNNFDLNLLKVFMCVYEQQSINKASEKLYISQPAVSYSIKKLENFLGCQLFKRLSKGCAPTISAENFYNTCKSGLFKLEQAIIGCNKNNQISAKLNIGANSSVIKFLLPKIKIFNQKFPNIKITFTEVITKRLQKYLERGDIDIALMEDTNNLSKALKKIEICDLNYCFVASLNNKINKITLTTLKDIKIAVSKKDTSIREFFEEMCKQNNIDITPFYEMASPNTILEFVKQDMCVGFLPIQYLTKDIKVLDCEFNIKKSSLVAIKRQEEDVYFVDEFIEHIKK